jgi:acetyl esterase/lipase
MKSPRRWLLLLVLVVLAVPYARAQEEQEHVRDVVYGKKMGVALTMDVFKPAKPNGIGVLWMVSGGWVSNHNNINPALAKVFTRKGQTVFQVVHGSQPKFTLAEIVQDIHRAVRFVRTNAPSYAVDPNRLGISGGSAGGHLSLMMGAFGAPGDSNAKDPVDRASSTVQAVACFFPPTDLLNYGKEGQTAIDLAMLRPFWPAFGVTDATPAEKRLEMGKSFSPIYGVTASMPPTLIVHGDKDILVPIQQAERFVAKLKEVNVPHKLEVRPGKGHGWAVPEMEQDLALMADWFALHLGKPAN